MSPGDQGPLSDSAFDLLNDYVDRFYAARKANPDTPLIGFLPPAGGGLRREVVLVELIKTDMEVRGEENLPVRLEDYIDAFPQYLTRACIDPVLLVEEYRLRRRAGENPSLEEYRDRFPEQYDAMLERLGSDLAVTRSAVALDTLSGDSGAAPTGSGVSMSGVLAGLGYRLIRPIGRGTFGEVYEAEAPGPVRVAVKRICRSLDDPASKGEIEALEAIKSLSTHPFLITTTAYWVFEDRLLIAMELADGNLEGRLRACQRAGLEGIPKEELIPIVEQAAAGLNYLHENGVTHRDIKPENILLQKGYAKVGDFGLARTQNHTQTIIQSPMGTLPFIAPEVFKNKMSPRSDQYSLAASYVLARLGRLLFSDVTAEALIVCHLTATPDLHDLPAPERKVLLKALAKSPRDRYPSCVAFAKALRDAALTPAEPPRPTPQWVTVGVAAAVCALMIGGLDRLNKQPRSDDGDRVKNPAKSGGDGVRQPKPWVPEGWAAVEEAGTTTHAQKEYYKKITRKVGTQDVTAVLILPVRPDDPRPYYLSENKITNGAFRAEWDRTKGFRTFLLDDPNRGKYVPGEWQNGAKLVPGGKRSGIKGKDNAPVLGVTLPEAMLFAEGVGGRIPTLDQLHKAVGLLDKKHPGPVGLPIEVPADLGGRTPGDFLQDELRRTGRTLALGLHNGPWDVTARTDDRSFCEIHQLLSNGLEWTATPQGAEPGARLKLFPLPAVDHKVVLFGQWWGSTEILTLNAIGDSTPRVASWTSWQDEEAGFRVVIDELP